MKNLCHSKMLPIGSQSLPQQEFCLHLNVSQCAVSESSSRFTVTAYNPRSHEVTTYVRLPVTNGVYTVLDPDGKHTHTHTRNKHINWNLKKKKI